MITNICTLITDALREGFGNRQIHRMQGPFGKSDVQECIPGKESENGRQAKRENNDEKRADDRYHLQGEVGEGQPLDKCLFAHVFIDFVLLHK
jgi:hypothetical protein